MRNKKRVLIKYTALMLILLSALLLSACRTRITNNNEVSNVYNDEDGFLSETYEMRRGELGLSTAKKPLLPDFGSNDDDEEDFDTGESFTYQPEEEEYVEPPEVQNANRTTNRTTNRSTTRTNRSSSGSGGTNRSTERVTITFNPNGGKCKTTEKKVYKGSKIGTLPEATKDGKTTKTWTTSKNGGSAVKSSDTVNGNITLYASWGESQEEKTQTFTVTFDAKGGKCSEKTRPVEKGKSIGNLPKPTKDNQDFVDWTTQSGSVVNSGYKVTKNITLYAKWKDPDKQKYEIIFDAAGGTVDKSEIEVVEGDSYGNLPTPTFKGHRFEGWYIGDTEVSPSDKPSQGETLTAKWLDWDGEDGIFNDILESLDEDQKYILADGAPEGAESFVNTCRGIVDTEDYSYVIQFDSDPEETGKQLVNSGNYKGKTVIVINSEALNGDKYDKILYQTVLINDLHDGYDKKVSEAVQEIGSYDRYIKKVPNN